RFRAEATIVDWAIVRSVPVRSLRSGSMATTFESRTLTPARRPFPPNRRLPPSIVDLRMLQIDPLKAIAHFEKEHESNSAFANSICNSDLANLENETVVCSK